MKVPMKIFLVLLLLCPLFYNIVHSNETIVVQLNTETHLLPIYITQIQDDKAIFDRKYLNELEKIILFDFNHNGMTSVIPFHKTKEDLAIGKELNDLGNSVEWKKKNVAYVIKIYIKDKKLLAKLLMVNTQTLKSISEITLSGDLRYDRKQIHILSDAIFKSLFGLNGIASTQILYTIKTKGNKTNTWNSEIFECDYDGANSRQVTENAGYCISPCYVPPKVGHKPGNYLYVSYKNGQPKIYIASLKENKGRPLTFLRGNQLMPAISFKRDKVALICDITGNPDLFLQPFSSETGPIGKPQQIFSAPNATQGSPAFSPDSKKIAFVSNKDGSPRIYILDIPSAGTPIKNLSVKLVTKANRESSAPAWSPDGNKLAYCALTKTGRQIWIYDFEKNEEKQLTDGPGHKENPSWAPNSLHLIFNSTGTSGSELYMINLNQPESVKITSGIGEKRFPNWGS